MEVKTTNQIISETTCLDISANKGKALKKWVCLKSLVEFIDSYKNHPYDDVEQFKYELKEELNGI